MVLGLYSLGAVVSAAIDEPRVDPSQVWIPYGDVHAVADDEDAIYIGGTFRHIGKRTEESYWANPRVHSERGHPLDPPSYLKLGIPRSIAAVSDDPSLVADSA